MDKFENLRVIITGGASGIGFATARQLLARGAYVAILDLNIDSIPDGAVAHQCDVGNRESVEAAVESAARSLQAIDVVINSAGIGSIGSVEDHDDEDWFRVLNVNVTGIARVSTAALPYLRQSSSPAIVNVSSIAATHGLPQRALYSASKGAVAALTRAMAADYIHEGIRVNCVTPGTADTAWVRRLLESAKDPVDERKALEARQPHGRLVSPDEVAASIMFLVDPANGSTTGTSLAVDSGMHGLLVRPVA